MTLLAAWVAIYSAALHGRRPWRTPVLAAAMAVIMAELVRELFFTIPDFEGKLRVQGFILAYNAVILGVPWALGAAMRSLRDRQRELA